MKFRKKPIIIEAVLITKDIPKIIDGLPAWFRDAYEARYVQFHPEWGMIIPTLEGDMEANFGDWVIQGVEGELYPCKPKIFEKTYERID